jgi:hypothetical protein
MSTIAAIHVFCQGNPSLGSAVVDGLLAWAAFLGASTAFWSALPAAVALFIPSRPDSLSQRIDRELGQGLLVGTLFGALLFFVFVARIVS